MRHGIAEQLPSTLSGDKIVFIVGPEEHPGLSGVKQHIGRIDARGEWIRAEFRDQVPKTSVPKNAGVVLTMTNMKHGALANARKGALEVGARCPNQALTPAEVKEILGILYSRRDSVALTGRANGNEHKLTPEFPNPKPELVPAVASSEVSIPVEAEATDRVDEIDEIIAVIGEFDGAYNKLQDKILALVEPAKQALAEVDRLKKLMVEKDIQVADLVARLADAQKLSVENAELKRENSELKTQVTEIQGVLNNLQNLIKGAVSKK